MYRLMLAEKANYHVTTMSRALEIDRKGFYKWLKRTGGEDPWEELKEAIMDIYEASKRRFGARKVHAKLKSDHGDRFAGVTLYRVQKCMRELGIQGVCPHARKQTTVPSEDAKTRPDLVKRDLASPVPTYKLVGDITYLKTLSGFIYLATVIDLATRMVVGWAIADNMRAQLVVSAMEMAWSRGYVAGNAIFHSDRGSQYTSSLFAAWAKAHDVRLSVGRTGSCHDNAVAESFFGTLKNEWAHHERLTDAETTKFRTIEFIESYYNRYRPHEAIGDRVPAEAMAEFFERFEEAMSYEPELPLAA
jgi:transposase InsO family protein